MLINRYFSRELINYLLTVTVIVLVIFLGNQLIRYLNDAAAGDKALLLVAKLILLETPRFLVLLLPITLPISVLLVFGQFSADNELVVLKACGLSSWQKWQLIARPCTVLLVCITLLALWAEPKLALYRNQLLSTTNGASIDSLIPGKFQPGLNGRYVFYVEKNSVNHKKLSGVFIAEKNPTPSDPNHWNVIKAKQGQLIEDRSNGAQFVQISDGMRAVGEAGSNYFQLIQFKRYLLLLHDPIPASVNDIDSYGNAQLISLVKAHILTNNLSNRAMAELEWRISLPLSSLLLAILACLVGEVPARHGRYARLLPGVLFLIIYINVLLMTRDSISSGTIRPFPGIFAVHGFCVLVILLCCMPWRKFLHRKAVL